MSLHLESMPCTQWAAKLPIIIICRIYKVIENTLSQIDNIYNDLEKSMHVAASCTSPVKIRKIEKCLVGCWVSTAKG